MARPRRLTLVIHSLAAGGAERVLALLASAWAERNQSVTLLTLDDGSVPPFQPLHPAVRHLPLSLEGPSPTPLHALLNNGRRIRELRRAFRDSTPDVVVAFMVSSNLLSLLAARPLGIPVVVSERSDPAVHDVGRVRSGLRARLYPRAAGIVVLTETARRGLPEALRPRATVIPNPVPAPPPAGPSRPTPGTPGPRAVVALGRLSPEKGFDLLLDAFARVAQVHPGWNLTIWGEGPERANLESRRAELGLEGRVDLPGTTQTPHAALRAGDVFVLPSRFEGFPNALCEALACGLPTISFDCESGPREIVTHGVDGILVPPADIPCLATELDRLMRDTMARQRLAARAPEVLVRFGMDAVLARWDACLDAIG